MHCGKSFSKVQRYWEIKWLVDLQFTTLQYSALFKGILQYSAVHCAALHCNWRRRALQRYWPPEEIHNMHSIPMYKYYSIPSMVANKSILHCSAIGRGGHCGDTGRQRKWAPTRVERSSKPVAAAKKEELFLFVIVLYIIFQYLNYNCSQRYISKLKTLFSTLYCRGKEKKKYFRWFSPKRWTKPLKGDQTTHLPSSLWSTWIRKKIQKIKE